MYLYTKRGIYHKQKNESSGDIVRGTDNGEFAVLTLADGVSSCKYGAEGASLVSFYAMEYVYRQFADLKFLPNEWPVYMLNSVKKQLKIAAHNDEALYNEYSSTLMVLVLDRMKSILNYCSIGDGILLAIDNDKCPVICMPQGDKNGCPVVTTEGIEKKILSGRMELANVNNILMCSDGAWKMMYNHNMLKPDIKNILLSGNFNDFKEYIRNAENMDDCSFAFADVRRAA